MALGTALSPEMMETIYLEMDARAPALMSLIGSVTEDQLLPKMFALNANTDIRQTPLIQYANLNQYPTMPNG